MAENTAARSKNQGGFWPTLGSWREALQSRRTSPPDYWLLAVVGALIIIGLVMLFSSSFSSRQRFPSAQVGIGHGASTGHSFASARSRWLVTP